MSDRVTNVEIEDVLTSIRKLVADGEWIRQRAAEANAAKGVEQPIGQTEAVDDAGKFVLTPALRVIESRAEVRGKSESLLRFRRSAEPEVVNNDVLWTPVAPEPETTSERLDEDLSEIDAEVRTLVETGVEAEPEEETFGDPETISDFLEMFDEEDDTADESAESEETEQGSYPSLGAAIAELEAAVGSGTEDWEPDGSETVLNDFTTPLRAVGGMEMPDIVDDEDGIDDPQPEVLGEVARAAEEDEASLEMLAVEAPEEEAPLDLAFFARPRESFGEPTPDAMLAEFGDDDGEERSLSFGHTEAEPAEEDGAAGETDATSFVDPDAMFVDNEATEDDVGLAALQPDPTADPAEAMVDEISDAIAETLAEDAANAIGDELDEDLAAYLSEETALDEDMLRDLITQVVRSELEGELGERMTRNIRKLVRREVFAVLESRGTE